MEQFLNSVWLMLVAAGLFAIVRAYRQGLDRRRFLLALGALLCAAAILFPSISITDDLHLDAFVMEDSNSTKRLGNTVSHGAPPAKVAWLGIVALPFLPIVPQRGEFLAEQIRSPYKAPFLIRHVLSRPPPAAFLA